MTYIREQEVGRDGQGGGGRWVGSGGQ